MVTSAQSLSLPREPVIDSQTRELKVKKVHSRITPFAKYEPVIDSQTRELKVYLLPYLDVKLLCEPVIDSQTRELKVQDGKQ